MRRRPPNLSMLAATIALWVVAAAAAWTPAAPAVAMAIVQGPPPPAHARISGLDLGEDIEVDVASADELEQQLLQRAAAARTSGQPWPRWFAPTGMF